MDDFCEYNFDGLIGPTHNFSGLGTGNLASDKNRFAVSNPKAAALQGLKKMRLICELGLKQGFFPPQERPHISYLRECGYTGSERQVLEKVRVKDPELLMIAASASSAWTANAATISPSNDCADRKIHITAANLVSQKHRSLETSQAAEFLKMIFFNPEIFRHHSPFPNNGTFFDEGAANHMRLCEDYGTAGIEIFVYGRKFNPLTVQPKRFPARHSFEASQEITKRHQLLPQQVVYAQQNPQAIDSGVFHNDVIAVGNKNVLLFHELAYVDTQSVVEEIRRKFFSVSKKDLCLIPISDQQLPLSQAVNSYLFNSQIITVDKDNMVLIAPEECRQNSRVQSLIAAIIAQENPIRDVHYVQLNESMRNGGGPACLRLRVSLNEKQAIGINAAFLLDPTRLNKIEEWVQKHYRDRLKVDDLSDYRLVEESQRALDELTRILGCGSIYSFQK